VLLGAALVGTALLGTACSSGSPGSSSTGSANGVITAVGVENEYADVIRQIGGRYVAVSTIMSDPNTDPHTFEASASVGKQVRAAQLVVQNGLGYDTFMTTIANADPSPSRTVLNVQQLRGLPDSTPNPHLWFDPVTMPIVAKALVSAMSKLQPAHAAYFQANATTFDDSLRPWTKALASFKAAYPNTPVAATEPVADFMLDAAGANNLTPFALQAAVMKGTDPAPQSVAAQTALLTEHKVKVLIYNQQVTDALTQTWLSAAQAAGIPVVGVYETMPTPGYTYQSWMLAEITALNNAVANHVSTGKL
jgi:zinc/manganese transport system substrate-binding protein